MRQSSGPCADLRRFRCLSQGLATRARVSCPARRDAPARNGGWAPSVRLAPGPRFCRALRPDFAGLLSNAAFEGRLAKAGRRVFEL